MYSYVYASGSHVYNINPSFPTPALKIFLFVLHLYIQKVSHFYTSEPDWVPTSLLLPPQVVLVSVIGDFILQLSTSPKLSSFCLKLYIHLLNKSCWLCPQCILNPTCSTFTQLSKPSSASQLTFLLLPLPPNRLFLSQRPVMLWDFVTPLLSPSCDSPVHSSSLWWPYKAPIYFLLISLPRPLKSEMVPSSP